MANLVRFINQGLGEPLPLVKGLHLFQPSMAGREQPMRALVGAVAGLVVGAALLGSGRAEACGGFFCSQTPVDQSGEKIIFTVKDGSVEAHVQISYSGEAKKFSWVVPVESLPTLSIGSPTFFAALDQATTPRFELNWSGNQCNGYYRKDSVLTPQPSPANAGVNVVSREEVGPYDAAILQASDAAALQGWLVTNGYDLTAQGADALTPYVKPSAYFVALKLQQDKGVGDLRPIVLKMATGRACIPIRLTAIAARPDMPITAFVFADHRAVPENYRHVLINETKIDWLKYGSNYSQVATDAVNEAGGHAFLTEFAGKVSEIVPSLYVFDQASRWNTGALKTIAHPVDFLAALLQQGFPRDAAIQSLLRKYVPIPASLVGKVTEAQFYNGIEAYRAAIDSDPGRAPFDAAGFANELEVTVVAPLKHAKEVVNGSPYLTRLFTTMSAEEMTVDPEFQFNPDVPDVSNVHTAKATGTCGAFGNGPFSARIELPDGRFFNVSSSGGPITDGPSAQRIEQLPSSGGPLLIQDNSEAIVVVLRNAGGGTPKSGCASTGPELLPAALLAMAAWQARRKSR